MNNGRTRNRSRCRVYADILRALSENKDVKVTHLVHLANVPYDRLMDILDKMEKSGLISHSGEAEGSFCIITPKGQRYLVEFRKLEEFGSIFGVDV